MYCHKSILEGTFLDAFCGTDADYAGTRIDLSMCPLIICNWQGLIWKDRHDYRQFQWPIELLDVVDASRTVVGMELVTPAVSAMGRC